MSLANRVIIERLERTISYWLRLIIVFILLVGLSLNVVIGIRMANRNAYPPRTALCCQTPADYAGLDYEDVTFSARDGLEITGWYIPSKNHAAVILVHGFGGNRMMSLPVGIMLAEEGYGVLMIDLRAHGESDGEIITVWQAGDDIVGAVDYLQTRSDIDPQRIGVWGFSVGAGASVHAAAQSDDIQVVVADGLYWSRFKDVRGIYHGYTYLYGMVDWVRFTYTDVVLSGGSQPRALIDDVALMSPRLLLIIAAADSKHETLVAEQYQVRGGENVSVWVVPGTHHGGGWDLYPDDYRQHLLNYFSLLHQ